MFFWDYGNAFLLEASRAGSTHSSRRLHLQDHVGGATCDCEPRKTRAYAPFPPCQTLSLARLGISPEQLSALTFVMNLKKFNSKFTCDSEETRLST